MLTTFVNWTAWVLLGFFLWTPAAPPPSSNLDLQIPMDSLPAPQVYDHMFNMRNKDRNDSMATVFANAAEQYLAKQDWDGFLEVKTHQAANLINAFKDQDAVPVLMDLVDNYQDQLKARPQTAVSVYWFLAHCHHIRSQPLQAIRFFELWDQLALEKVAIEDKLQNQVLTEMCIAYNNLGRYNKSLQVAQRLLLLAQKNDDVGKEMLAYNLMGESYLPMGETNKSVGAFDRILEKDLSQLRPEQMNAEVRQYSIYLSNASYVQVANKNYVRALELIKRSLAHINNQPPNPYSVYEKMAVLPNLSLAYDHLNYDDSALMAIEEVLAIVRSIPRHSFELPKILMQRGKIYQKLGDRKMAENNFLEAIEVGKKFSRKSGIEVGLAHQLLGALYLNQKRYQDALQQFHLSITTLVPTYSETDVKSLPTPDQINAHKVELVSFLKDKASCLRLMFDQNGNELDLKSSLETYLLAIKLIDDSRGKILDNQSRRALYENSQSLYEETLQAAALRYKQTEEDRYLEAIFRTMEAKKANNLMDRFLDQRARQLVYIPDSITEKENELKSLIAYYQREIYQAEFQQQTDTAFLDDLKSNLFDAEQQYEQQLNLMANSYPAYQSYKQENQDISLQRFQNELLPSRTLALDYLWGENHIYLLAMDQNQTFFQEIPLNDLTQSIPTYLLGLKTRSFNSQQSRDLAETLIAQAIQELSGYNRLMIFTDGLLGYLPFETLMVGEKSDFLLNSYTVNYHLSAKLLGLPSINAAGKSENSFLGYAPVFEKESNPLLASRSADNVQVVSELERLPQAEQEVKVIADLLGGTYRIGDQATEADFKQSAQQSDIIHLASHTIIDDQNPLYSRLVFANSPDTLEDGLLHTYELYNLQLNAKLACLSACNTGVGVYHQGEGIVSLAQGFLHAGVPNVMMSLWSVPDRSTGQIMQFFYEELKKGKGKADALRDAKLKYLQTADANTGDPYFWAAFTLIGDNQPMVQKRWAAWQIGLVVLTLALLGLLWYRKNNGS